jgi:predicted Zn-dependent peptidase
VVFSTLRDREGLTYSASAYGHFSIDNPKLINLYAAADFDKNNLEQVESTLTKEIMRAGEQLKRRELQSAKLVVLADYHEGSKNSMFWKDYLLRQLIYQRDLGSIADVRTLLKQINRRDIRDLLKKILITGQRRRIVLISRDERTAN